jgi:solute carrier family 25 carnitine/acylcarnitine transporter 20/29
VEGFRALWKGFSACVLRAFPANAAGFLAYELCSKTMKELEGGGKS